MRGVVFDGKRAEVAYDLRVRDPGPGEVRVAIAAAGLCHSDLSVVDGTIPFPVPVVLGHEGAGVVEAVGVGVTSRPQRDIALYAELYRAGRLLLDELVTRTYPVEEFERAAADAQAGQVARGVLTF